MNYKRIVPNSISGISLVLGVISIFYTIEENFFAAALCILLSVVADSLDGRAAVSYTHLTLPTISHV